MTGVSCSLGAGAPAAASRAVAMPLPGAGLETTPGAVASRPNPPLMLCESTPAAPSRWRAVGHTRVGSPPGCDGEFGSRSRAPSPARRSPHRRTGCRWERAHHRGGRVLWWRRWHLRRLVGVQLLTRPSNGPTPRRTLRRLCGRAGERTAGRTAGRIGLGSWRPGVTATKGWCARQGLDHHKGRPRFRRR